MLEDFEAKWVTGERIDLSEYGFLVNTQRRVLSRIGLKRVPRDVSSPSSREILGMLDQIEQETAP